MPEMTPLDAKITSEVEALREENKLLREKIDLLVRRVFGNGSEKVDTDQLLLAMEGLEAKKPGASSDAAVALEAEESTKSKPTSTRGKRKGGITDEMLDLYCIVSSWDELSDRFVDRYDHVADRVIPYFATNDYRKRPADFERWAEAARDISSRTSG